MLNTWIEGLSTSDVEFDLPVELGIVSFLVVNGDSSSHTVTIEEYIPEISNWVVLYENTLASKTDDYWQRTFRLPSDHKLRARTAASTGSYTVRLYINYYDLRYAEGLIL